MTAAAGAPGRASVWVKLRGQLRNLAPLVTLAALVALFSAASPSFATWANLGNVLQQVSITAIIAVGLTFVILCAEIDLSVASTANATGILVAFLTVQDASVNIPNLPLPGVVAIAASVAGCLLLGCVTAFGVTRIGIPSFIMTLAMLQIGNGICALLVRGQIAYSVPPAVLTLGSGSIGPVPWIVVVAGLVLLAGHLVLTYTRFGRYIYMVGGNREAAEHSGVGVRAVVGAALLVSALCSGVAGMFGGGVFRQRAAEPVRQLPAGFHLGGRGWRD